MVYQKSPVLVCTILREGYTHSLVVRIVLEIKKVIGMFSNIIIKGAISFDIYRYSMEINIPNVDMAY